MPPGGDFIPLFGVGWAYPLKGVVLSPHWVMGGGDHAFGVVLSPPFGGFIPPLGGGGGRGGVVTLLGAERYGPSLC